jgi:peptidyl-prolyl cis-trans isomerase A (cyclophilin A)
MTCSSILGLRHYKYCLALSLALLLSAQSASATTVRVTTPLGEFSIELFDEDAPGTVANFLNYVNSGRFNGTVIHRSVTSPVPFIIQGGGFSFDAVNGQLPPIATYPAIQNEFGIPNTRGTVAMAKLGGDPDSATSQWFVNLADNRANLDKQNGGFTVFGKVIGDGMAVVDTIAAQPTVTILAQPNLNVAELTNFPLINFNGGSLLSSNFITVEIQVEEAPQAPNYFDESAGLLRVTVDAGTSGLATLAFTVSATEPDVVIKLDLNSVAVISESVDKIATFDAATGRLVLPELVVSGAAVFSNLVFVLSDAEQLLFTLESFEQI